MLKFSVLCTCYRGRVSVDIFLQLHVNSGYIFWVDWYMKKSSLFGLNALFAAVITACGGGGDSPITPVSGTPSVSSAIPVTPPPPSVTAPVTAPPPTSAPVPPPLAVVVVTGPTVQGTVIAGPVKNASVDIFEVDSKGVNLAKLGSGNTSANGTYSIVLSRAIAVGMGLRVVATGGTYVSEADTKGVLKTHGKFETLVALPPTSGAITMHVTALTHFVSTLASQIASTQPKTLSAALIEAELALKKWVAVDSASGLSGLLPDFAGTETAQARIYGLVLGALEELAKNLAKNPIDIYAALACDFSDGVIDGKNVAGACPIGTDAALETLGTIELIRAINTYIISTTTIHVANGVETAPLAISPRTAVTAVSPATSGVKVGSTGAISFMRLSGSGKEVVLIAAREQGLVMVDMSNPSAPVVNRLDELNALISPLMASVGGVIPIPGAVSSQAMLYSYTSKKLITVNLDTNTIINSADLGISKTSSFSGASGVYVAGGVPDVGRGLIWLATADGYKAVNPTTLSIKASSAMPLAVPENMGGDTSRGMLFGPNYGGASSGAVDWVDLTGDTPVTYSMSGADWTNYRKDQTGVPDSGTVDVGYNVGLIIGEDVSNVLAVNLDKSLYNFSPSAKSFKAKDPSSSVVTNLTGMTLAGSSVDSVAHYALLMAGYSNSVVVAKLDNPASPKTGVWTGLEGFKGFSLSNADFAYAKDPHAVGAFNIKDKSYGFLLNNITTTGIQKVMLIDMEAFYKSSAGSNNILTSNPLGTSVKALTWSAR
jgi:hypothetical protein